jgi:pyruvate dehydrogenase E2 component (dihydrolipoamide acetyltransferase)
MATEVVMPKLGLTMETGMIGAWLVEEGDQVEKGQPLLEVVTDKVSMVVEAQAGGILRQVLAPAGEEEIPVSTPIAIIAGAEEDISALQGAGSSAPASEIAEASTAPEQSSAIQAPATVASANGRKPHRASPKARRIAAERGIDMLQLQGSGPGGRIVSADVETYADQGKRGGVVAEPATVAASDTEFIELTRAQQITGERLTASYQSVPHIHISMHVSAVWLQQFRQGYALEGKQVSYNDLIVKATGRSLVNFPRLNSTLQDGRIQQFDQVNIGIAADTPKGLLVPVIKHVSDKSIEAIAEDSVRLVDCARRGEIQPDDLSGGTFTISNLGMFGVSQFTAIINPPQVAILAVGGIENRVVGLENNAFAVRPHLTLTLAADHRVVDGALAARFLQYLRQTLETPGMLA